MYIVSDIEFNELVQLGIKRIPAEYIDKIENVDFYVAEYPSQQQMKKLKLKKCDSLLGLYEGVPLTDRSGGYLTTLPDKITIFKNSHESISSNRDELKKHIAKTIWHEVAHYFGLDHAQIDNIENKRFR